MSREINKLLKKREDLWEFIMVNLRNEHMNFYYHDTKPDNLKITEKGFLITISSQDMKKLLDGLKRTLEWE